MYYVYALKSINKRYIYVGLTNNVERRVGEHNTGKEQTTKPYRPFKLLITEELRTRVEARKREKYYKSGIGKERLYNIAEVAKLVDAHA